MTVVVHQWWVRGPLPQSVVDEIHRAQGFVLATPARGTGTALGVQQRLREGFCTRDRPSRISPSTKRPREGLRTRDDLIDGRNAFAGGLVPAT